MAKEIAEKCGEDTADFLKDFTTIYMQTFVSKKLEGIYDDAVNKVIPEELQGDDDEDKDEAENGEEKEEENNDDGGDNAGGDDAGGDEANKDEAGGGDDGNKEEAGDDNANKDDGNKEEEGGDDDKKENEKEEKDENKDEEKDEDKEEDGDDEKGNGKVIACGASAIKYKIGVGPDRVEHFYLDTACFAIKKKNSVITKKTCRHSIIESDLKKKLERQFKKLASTKQLDTALYKARFNGIRVWLDAVTKVNELSTSDLFISFFGLKYDPMEDFLNEVFEETIEQLCDDRKINYDNAKNKAEKLGLDMEKVEMLKVVAVETIGIKHMKSLKELVQANKILPGKLKNKAIKKGESTVAGVISKGVEAGWKGLQESFEKISGTMSETIDKAAEPINGVLGKALEPIGEVIKGTFKKVDGLLTVKVKKQTLNVNRFENICVLMNSLDKGESGKDGASKLLTSINKMNECEKYACYLTFNFKIDDNIKKFIPFIQELEESNNRLAIALTDLVYVLGRSFIRAITPILTLLDTKEFKKDTFNIELINAIREGGKKLAVDYFALPKSLRKTCRGIGKKPTGIVLRLAKKIVRRIADLLGCIGASFKPTSKDSLKKDFIKIATPLLNKFLDTTTNDIFNVLKKATQNMIATKTLNMIKDKIGDIVKTLDDLVKELPEPIGNNLKPSAIIYYLVGKAVSNITVLAVKKLLSDVKKNIYNKDSNPEPMNKNECRRLRYKPVVREKDFDDEPEKDDDKDDDKKNDKKDKDNDDKKENDDDKDTADDKGGDDAAGDDAAGDDAGDAAGDE